MGPAPMDESRGNLTLKPSNPETKCLSAWIHACMSVLVSRFQCCHTVQYAQCYEHLMVSTVNAHEHNESMRRAMEGLPYGPRTNSHHVQMSKNRFPFAILKVYEQ